MKKILALALSLILVLSLAACGSKEEEKAPEASTSTEESGEFKFTETLTIVVPFTAGGSSDVIVRQLQPYLEEQLGVSIVIENPEGAGGTIGTTQYINDGPDPYKAIMMAPTSIVFRPLSGGAEYSYAEDLIAVSQLNATPICLGIKDDFPIQDAEELLADIMANPGKYSYASGGAGSISDVAFAVLLMKMGADVKAVPFSGAADQYTAVMGGHVDMMTMNVTETISKEGVHPIINLGTNTGHPYCEGIPTAADLGYEGVVTDTAFGLGYHRDIDPAVVEALDKAVKAALEDPDCIATMEEYGQMIYYRNHTDYDAWLTQFIDSTAATLDEMGLLAK